MLGRAIAVTNDFAVRQVRERALTGGSEANDPGDTARVRHRLSFEVRAETMALFRQLQESPARGAPDPRAEGGTHDPERLAALCGAHHRAIHRGRLHVDGTAGVGFRFWHTDGRPYGQPLDPPAIDLARQVLIALTHLGFKRAQAEHLIQHVQRRGAPGGVAEFLRAALRAYEP